MEANYPNTLKIEKNQGVVAHTFTPGTWEAEASRKEKEVKKKKVFLF